MKIIHCADIHLDAKMESSLPQQKAQERHYELLLQFERMIDYAKANEVRVVMIAGDLFDSTRLQSGTVRRVLDAIAAAREIDFLYLQGNHDEGRRLLEDFTLPDNLKLFQETWTSFTYDNVRITGAVLGRENCLDIYDSLQTDPDKINLVVLHGQTAAQAGEDRICLPRLKNRNIRYLALGHLHSYRQAPLDEEGVYCYAGCLEGRGFDECGEKGFVLLETDEKGLTSQFMPFAKRKLHDIGVDISGLDRMHGIADRMKEAAAQISSEDLVQFTLQGEVSPEADIDPAFLQKAMESFFYFVRIKDESCLHIDGAYRYDRSLKGTFIRMVLDSDKSDKEKEQMILCGLAALKGEKHKL